MQLEKLASEATLRQELANEATRPVPQSSLDMATIHVVEHSPPSSSDPCLQNTTTLATTTTLSTATPSFSSIASPALGPRVSQSFSVSSPLPAQPTLTSPLQAPPLSSPPLVASSPLAPCLPSPAIRPRAPSFAAIQVGCLSTVSNLCLKGGSREVAASHSKYLSLRHCEACGN